VRVTHLPSNPVDEAMAFQSRKIEEGHAGNNDASWSNPKMTKREAAHASSNVRVPFINQPTLVHGASSIGRPHTAEHRATVLQRGFHRKGLSWLANAHASRGRLSRSDDHK
jgi:hypothetical protein